MLTKNDPQFPLSTLPQNFISRVNNRKKEQNFFTSEKFCCKKFCCFISFGLIYIAGWRDFVFGPTILFLFFQKSVFHLKTRLFGEMEVLLKLWHGFLGGKKMSPGVEFIADENKRGDYIPPRLGCKNSYV